MSRINYPTEGLKSVCASNVQDSINCLSKAINTPYSVPNSFGYASYLKKLPSRIDGLLKRAYDISNFINDTDNSFNVMSETMDSYKNSLDLTVIESRDRLVK